MLGNSKARRRERQRENRQAAAIARVTAREAEARADATHDEHRKYIKDPTANIAISKVMTNH